MITMKQYQDTAEYLKQHGGQADIALVLGSGLGGYEESLTDVRYVDYSSIPGFPVSTVAGHAGRFAIGRLQGKRLLMMCGRFHSYEGYSMAEVTMAIRVMHLMGIKTVILTNAAGGVNEQFRPGDLMLITDYLNFSGRNPLRGLNMDAFGPRFPDMTHVFSPDLRALTRKKAEELGIPMQEGVYCWFNGPTYETPAEIRMARTLGADAVGMSTVPEAMVARHCGMQVLGISTITNMAAGISGETISHEEVMQAGRDVKASFTQLMDAVIAAL